MTSNNFALDAAQEACINGHPEVAEDLLRGRDLNDPRVRFNLGWHELRHGHLSKGMEMLDAGRFINCYGSSAVSGRKLWNPKEVDPRGKTILLRSEGGYGDEIINIRFAQTLRDRGANVVVSCHPSLMSLFSRAEGVSAVVSNAAVHDCHYDYWLPAMSAPHVLGVEFDTLRGAPYLCARSEESERWRRILKGKMKVGIRWLGSPKFEHQQFRVFDPEPLFELAKIDGVAAYSLQRDEGSEMLPKDSDVIDLGPLLTDWETTAAIIANLDLVITSCTSIGHLAAALGKPTWIIVPVMPYYTWAYSAQQDGSTFGGDTSPWHDTVRLFRQEKFGDWDAPLLRVREALRDLVAPERKRRREHATCDGGIA